MRRLIHQSLDSVQVIKWILWRRSIQRDLSLPLFDVIVLSLFLSPPFNGQPPTPMSAYTPRETTPRVHFVPPKLQGKPEYNSFVRRVYSSRKKFSIPSLLRLSFPLLFHAKYFLVRSNDIANDSSNYLKQDWRRDGGAWLARNRNGRELEFYGSPNELKRNEAAIVDLFAPPTRTR